MSAASDEPISTPAMGTLPVISGARLDRWLWSRERLIWADQITHGLKPFPTLASLDHASWWPREKRRLERFLATVQRGAPGEGLPSGADARPDPNLAPLAKVRPLAAGRMRAVQWNILKGISFEGLVEWLRDRPRLAGADFVVIEEADIGMARSGNRHVAAELAARLALHWVYAANYWELTKGPGPDAVATGENLIGLQGVAILSRRPPIAVARIPLPECFPMFDFPEKRYGGRAGIVASFPRGLVVAGVHLEVRNTPRCRAGQMREFLAGIERFVESETRAGRPVHAVLIGGDLNTHTFSRTSLAGAFRGLLRVAGTPHGLLHHTLMHPWVRRSEPLFVELARAGYRWKELNDLQPTADEVLGNAEEVSLVPAWLSRIIMRLFSLYERRVEMRLDWFAGRGIEPAHPDGGVTIGDVQNPLTPSDHLPIALDFEMASEP